MNKKLSLNNELLLNFAAEFMGTFIFIGTIVTVINSSYSNMNFLKIGLSLMVAICFFGDVSGGAFNPAVSLMFYINNRIKLPVFIIHVIAQICACLLAFVVFKWVTSKGIGMDITN